MISIRKYLDAPLTSIESEPPQPRNRRAPADLVSFFQDAYRSALSEMGRCSVDACPATGPQLQRDLIETTDGLAASVSADTIAASSTNVRKQLQQWGRATARHYQQKAGEVKGILIAMAHTAESVGQRDQRCAEQLHSVTTQLKRIANLDDITVMRRSIERNAAELKGSIERMVIEGKAVLDELQTKVATFQTKLDEAEQTASCDALTRLRSRLCIDGQLEQRIAAGQPFSVAVFDIDGFKLVNDAHGHVTGDELLKQFATELRSACRSCDIVGRWGGDEFIVLLDCERAHAEAQIERVRKWVCGNYVVEGIAGAVKLSLSASVGLAEFAPPESVNELLDRADAAMYRHKAATRAATVSA
jgi:diguanylate cyclase (GGDEF)-like protein